mgnify:CR=1 FL=1
MKKFLYILSLVLMVALSSFVFSFFGVDRFVFYVFFSFLGAYLCGIKQVPVVLIFLVLDMIIFKTKGVYILELSLFYILLSLFSKKMGVYVSAVLAILICFGAGAFFTDAFIKLPCYILSLVFAPPFVFALMRGRVIRRRYKW